ncbi:MAG: prolyl oligopeptidase family serine peptidase [Gemmatimonadetes bacterium]|nr:prolyl oligopeptidase family serine peptidase [Gemmatimonadota bacterium]
MDRLARPLALILLATSSLSAQQQPITPDDFGKWESLGAMQLSPDGRWIAYAVNRVDEENELRVRRVESETTDAFRYASGTAFSADSRWLAFTIGVSPAERERLTQQKQPVRSRFALMDLSTGDTLTISDIASFTFSADGRFVALRGFPGEGSQTSDLIVRELATGTSTTFGNVTGSAWSDAGPLLAFTVQASGGAGNGIQLWDAAAGALRALDASASTYRALAWREDAADLAVLRTRADSAFRDTTHVVLAWTGLRRTTAAARAELEPASASGFPAGVRVSEDRTPVWAEDGSIVYIGLRAREPARTRPGAARDSTAKPDSTALPDSTAKPDSAKREEVKPSDVQVWHARDVRIMPMQKVQEQQDLRRTLLAAWHVRENRVVQIGSDLLENARVLKGDRIAIEPDRKPYAYGAMFGRPAQDVWTIDIRTGERRKVLENIRFFQGPSTGGRYLLWFDGTNHWSHDLQTGRRANLTAGVDADFRDHDYDFPVDQLPSHGSAGWTKDDAAVLLYDEFDIWSVAPDGSGGRKLTDGAPDRIAHRYIRTQSDEDGIDTSRPLVLSISGERTKQTGFARLRRGRGVERMILDDARIFRLARADSADVFAFTRERFDDSPDWFVASAELRDARQVSTTNPFQADYAWGRAELVDFTSATGRDLQAVLLYPPNHDPSRRYPMIVYTYERLSQSLHGYVVPSERSYYNYNVFTANGYFVLLPDIVYRDNDPGLSALEAVVPAVKTIVDRGLIDAARIGLIGHSWGGYQATFLPTRTNIFAASVAGAPITNFLSFPGAIHWTPGIAEFDHWETGQARMRVAPWEDFEAHLRNSPIHKVQALETPMLMMFGDADGTVDWHQGIEFYNFARRAGKTNFVMLVYPGEDHGLRKKENQIDYHRRILEWFGHWLKGEEAPAWITEGMTWLDRKKRLEGGK